MNLDIFTEELHGIYNQLIVVVVARLHSFIAARILVRLMIMLLLLVNIRISEFDVERN